VEQFIAFAPGGHAHDDGPDAVEGAVWKIMDKEGRKPGAGVMIFPKHVNDNRL